MMLVSTISYIDRTTLAALAPVILRDTHLSAEQYGYIVSAFSIAYMIGNPVWGWILDRIGIRAGMASAVAMWTAASVAHVFAMGLGSFAAARAVLGFGEGATFPGALRTAMQTLPPRQRSRGTAIAYSGGSFGAIITPPIVTRIAVAWGWRGAFWFTGLVGALWLVLWAALGKRKELSSSAAAFERGAVPAADSLAPRWSDPRLWAFVATYALGAFPLGFVLYQTSLYLSAFLQKSQGQIGDALWIPPLGWEVGYFFWGWVADRFTDAGSIGSLRRQFRWLTVLSLPLAAVPRITSFAGSMAMLFFATFVAAGFIIGPISYATRCYSAQYAGLIGGIGAGSWSAVVALVMPAMGKLFDLHLYGEAFLITALFPAVGYAIWSGVNRRPERLR